MVSLISFDLVCDTFIAFSLPDCAQVPVSLRGFHHASHLKDDASSPLAHALRKAIAGSTHVTSSQYQTRTREEKLLNRSKFGLIRRNPDEPITEITTRTLSTMSLNLLKWSIVFQRGQRGRESNGNRRYVNAGKEWGKSCEFVKRLLVRRSWKSWQSAWLILRYAMMTLVFGCKHFC